MISRRRMVMRERNGYLRQNKETTNLRADVISVKNGTCRNFVPQMTGSVTADVHGVLVIRVRSALDLGNMK